MDTNTLRELSRAASPAPWGIACYCPHNLMVKSATDEGALNSYFAGIVPGEGVTVDEDISVAPMTEKVADFLDYHRERPPGNPGPTPNAALIVALRNDAEKYADLRDAGMALAARLHEMYLGAETREKLAVFVAALAALGGEE